MFNIYLKSISSVPLEYSLTELWRNSHPNVYVNSIDGCPIEKFKLCDNIACLNDSENPIFTIESNTLKVDLSKPLSEQTVYITPITTGGVMDPQPIKIKVCGGEVVSPKSQNPIISLLPLPISGEFKFDVKTLFDNSDPLCPIRSFKLESSNGAPLVDKDAIKAIKLVDSTLTIQKSQVIKADFNVVATSTGGAKASKKF
jgi:hypothetical protein